MSRGYIQFIINAFQANMAYRLNVVIRMFSYIISIFIQVSIWRALYDGANETDTPMGSISFEEMVTYVMISAAMSLFIKNEVIGKMERKIRSGEIAMDLIKPMNLKLLFLSETLGNNAFKVIFQLLPLLAAGAFLLGLKYPEWHNLLLFFFSLINAFILYFLLTYLVGLLAFWYMSIWHLSRFLGDLIGLLSGSIIPLWFFPGILLHISAYLPFQLIYFAPISIYLEKLTVTESLGLIIQQWVWIVLLFIAERILWSKAFNKLVVQGG